MDEAQKEFATKVQELESDLYSMDTHQMFHDLLNSELVYDTLCGHLVALQEPVLKSERELSAALAPVLGPNNWKAKFDGTEPLQPVLDHAVTTILKIGFRGAQLPLV